MDAAALTPRLKERTRALHRVAERAGIMNVLLAGRISRGAYCALLRNLHALYDALECALDDHARSAALDGVRLPRLYRAAALQADLLALHGDDWPSLPLAAAMRDYVARIRELSRRRPVLLSAHVYVRYQGDLSGGQLLLDIVRRSPALAGTRGAKFYAFGTAREVAAYKAALRAGLDALPVSTDDADAIVAEAEDAFARHVRLFEELVWPHGDAEAAG